MSDRMETPELFLRRDDLSVGVWGAPRCCFQLVVIAEFHRGQTASVVLKYANLTQTDRWQVWECKNQNAKCNPPSFLDANYGGQELWNLPAADG